MGYCRASREAFEQQNVRFPFSLFLCGYGRAFWDMGQPPLAAIGVLCLHDTLHDE